MKKILFSGLLLTTISSLPAMAENAGPGCGLGENIWKGQTGLMPHISAATTNGTGSQTFAITSGTLGCEKDAMVYNDLEKKAFVAFNTDDLAKDAAQGNGNHLASLADMIGIKAQDQPAFFKLTQNNYGTIFQSETLAYDDVLAALDDAMAADVHFAQYVTN